MKKLMLSCKDATHYISMDEEKKLSFSLKAKLLFHLMMCKVCALFAKQNQLIVKQIKNIQPSQSLSQIEKEAIHSKIIENNS